LNTEIAKNGRPARGGEIKKTGGDKNERPQNLKKVGLTRSLAAIDRGKKWGIKGGRGRGRTDRATGK